MPYNFQYVPTSGTLSGESFEKQTEKAINEIGAYAEDALENAQEIADDALAAANAAQAAANNAVITSQNAQTIAQSAQTTANAAQGAAQAAQNTANGAQTRADGAYDLAANADSKANVADSKADAAQALAESAADFSSAAFDAAGQAQSTADAALTEARNASGYYSTIDDAVDANTQYKRSERSKITNVGSSNFPIAPPLYLTVFLDDTYQTATQFAWSANGTSDGVYIRTGAIAEQDGEFNATWQEWAGVGGGGRTGILGEIRLLPFRPTELPTGWHFCNGDQYPLTSAIGAALDALPANLKTDFDIVVSGGNISIPNMFYSDGRGYFLRAVDGTTRMAGSVETDAIRNITGSWAPWKVGDYNGGASVSGAITSITASTNSAAATGSANGIGFNFNASRVVPTASENKSLNIGMTPAIFLGV